MRKKVGRVGEKRTMRNGMDAIIIDYRRATDIDIQFDDGKVKERVTYGNFAKGQVAHPDGTRKKKTCHIGETLIMRSGLKATITAYRSYRDLDIRFEDGQIREHVRYDYLIKGKIAHPQVKMKRGRDISFHINETRTMNNGMKATIIAYHSSHDVDIQFEDGQIRNHILYSNFARGQVAHPAGASETQSSVNHIKSSRVGETRTMNNGMKATIVAYRSFRDVDIIFEDGQIRKKVRYSRFIDGCVAHPDGTRKKKACHIGETRVMNNGMKATIVAYRSFHDVDIQFEDGCEKKNVNGSNFIRGEISHPGQSSQMINKKAYRVGETRTMNSGLTATVVAYRSNRDIDVLFKDGTRKEHVAYASFLSGRVAHVDGYKLLRIGETHTMSNGMKATIVAYRSYQDIDVEFEDGQGKQGVSYQSFSKGHVAHPQKLRKGEM